MKVINRESTTNGEKVKSWKKRRETVDLYNKRAISRNETGNSARRYAQRSISCDSLRFTSSIVICKARVQSRSQRFVRQKIRERKEKDENNASKRLTACFPNPFHSCFANDPLPLGSQAAEIISGLYPCQLSDPNQDTEMSASTRLFLLSLPPSTHFVHSPHISHTVLQPSPRNSPSMVSRPSSAHSSTGRCRWRGGGVGS